MFSPNFDKAESLGLRFKVVGVSKSIDVLGISG
jgi:hypothetical protein